MKNIMKHDEKKIEELIKMRSLERDRTVAGGIQMCAEDAMKQYSEHMVQQEREIFSMAKNLLELVKCPVTDCDNNGTIGNYNPYMDEYEPEQCQWCDERKKITILINKEDE